MSDYEQELVQLAAEIAAEEHLPPAEAAAKAVATIEDLYREALDWQRAALAQRSIPVSAP